jgi:hypothetical protein
MEMEDSPGYHGFEIPTLRGSRTVFLAPGLHLPLTGVHQVRHHAVWRTGSLCRRA